MANHRWNPWRHFRDHHPHIDIHFVDLDHLNLLGRVTREGIEINKSSEQRERRSTLTHEAIHLERGPIPRHRHFAQREERVVEELTARLLIPIEDLLDTLLWCHGRADDEAADELWVDLDVLNTRIATLKPCERRWVDQEIARRSH